MVILVFDYRTYLDRPKATTYRYVRTGFLSEKCAKDFVEEYQNYLYNVELLIPYYIFRGIRFFTIDEGKIVAVNKLKYNFITKDWVFV